MEEITCLKQYDYDAEEGYQAFIDACEAKWNKLSIEEKVSEWKKYN